MVKQIDGDHYGDTDSFQHWDWVVSLRIQYLPATASKYICRWRKKNGVVDLDKARSYLQKWMENTDSGTTPFFLGVGSGTVNLQTQKLTTSQELHPYESNLCAKIALACSKADIHEILLDLDKLYPQRTEQAEPFGYQEGVNSEYSNH